MVIIVGIKLAKYTHAYHTFTSLKISSITKKEKNKNLKKKTQKVRQQKKQGQGKRDIRTEVHSFTAYLKIEARNQVWNLDPTNRVAVLPFSLCKLT